MRTIYIELIFLDNMLLNALALYVAARLCGAARSLPRIALGAALGGAYAVVCAFWSAGAGLPGKLAAAALMCAFAYGRAGLRELAGRLIGLCAVAMAMGGAALALSLAESGGLSGGGRWTLLAALAVCAAIEALGRRSKRRQVTAGSYIELSASILGEPVCLRGFVDTGNALRDRITGEGVIIAEKSAVTGKLSAEAAARIESVCAFGSVETSLKPRVFCFDTLGGGGIMAGIKPAGLRVRAHGAEYGCAAYIALTDVPLGLSADAIVGADLRLTS